jgi:hypothetical protein
MGVRNGAALSPGSKRRRSVPATPSDSPAKCSVVSTGAGSAASTDGAGGTGGSTGAATAATTQFSVGDRVRLAGGAPDSGCLGSDDVGSIYQAVHGSDDDEPYEVMNDDGKRSWYKAVQLTKASASAEFALEWGAGTDSEPRAAASLNSTAAASTGKKRPNCTAASLATKRRRCASPDPQRAVEPRRDASTAAAAAAAASAAFPIANLPANVLRHVLLGVPDQDVLRKASVCAQVCSDWRRVVFDSPAYCRRPRDLVGGLWGMSTGQKVFRTLSKALRSVRKDGSLRFIHTDLGDGGAKALAAALLVMPRPVQLTALKLDGCDLSPAGLGALLEAIRPGAPGAAGAGLERLDLNVNPRLGDVAIAALAAALPPTLVRLSITSVGCGDAGAETKRLLCAVLHCTHKTNRTFAKTGSG